ncbi:MAG TPA: methyltransferase domain-containing protein [Candidatus Polarisedimenticolaceae bacterium]|nr:methyltransferase domain-containing protein [Candidatus Polarisedimenticolaceae bacterium]
MRHVLNRGLRKVRYEIVKLPRDRDPRAEYAALYPAQSLDGRRFYNVGAGGFSHPLWTNVDFISDWYSRNDDNTRAGIQYDLFSLEPIPVEDATAEVVYTSHTVEHIHDEAAANAFREAYRMLKPGGFFRVTTPDAELAHAALERGDRAYFWWMFDPRRNTGGNLVKPLTEASIEQVFLVLIATSVSTIVDRGGDERVDDAKLRELLRRLGRDRTLEYCTSRCPVEIQQAFPGYHMNWWTAEKLSRMLREAGFDTTYRSGYGQSHCPVLRDVTHFDNTRPYMSLYVEAVK